MVSKFTLCRMKCPQLWFSCCTVMSVCDCLSKKLWLNWTHPQLSWLCESNITIKTSTYHFVQIAIWGLREERKEIKVILAAPNDYLIWPTTINYPECKILNYSPGNWAFIVQINNFSVFCSDQFIMCNAVYMSDM